MRHLLILLIICLMRFISTAQTVRIQGKDTLYSGKELVIKSYSDPFTNNEEVLARTLVQSDGNFNFKIDLEETRLILLPLGVYKGYLFAEPDKTYIIKLPPRRDKNTAEKLNPYFKQEELFLGIENASQNDINILIRRFDDQLDRYINQNFNKIYQKGKQSVGLQYIQEIDSQYSSQENLFFKEYLRYRLALLEYLAYPRSFGRIQNRYFKNQKIQYYNPAYTGLFKKLYDNFLTGYLDSKEGESLNKALSGNDVYKEMVRILQKYEEYSDIEFLNMILLKGAYDAYNSNFYSYKNTISLLEGIRANSPNNTQRRIAQNIISKISLLRKGSPAPDFNLYSKSEQINLSKYNGKFLYISFFQSKSYTCLQDMEELEKLHMQFGDKIKFLSIIIDLDSQELDAFLRDKKFQWTIIPARKNQQIIQEYNLRTFPTYILIDPNGDIIKAPAPGPQEHISHEFLRIYRHIQRQEYQRDIRRQ